MAGALTPHLTDSNYDEPSEDEDDDDVEKRVACQKSEEYNEWIYWKALPEGSLFQAPKIRM